LNDRRFGKGRGDWVRIGRQLTTEANYRFTSFGPPFAATKFRGGGEIPLERLREVFGDFEMTPKFERNHGVTGFLVEQRELSGRVSAAARAANTCRDLFPIRHFLGAL